MTGSLPMQGVIITDPHLASELLLGTGKDGIDKSPVIRSLDLVLSGTGHSGMLTSNTTDHWKAVRKGVAPAFSTANIRCGCCHTERVMVACRSPDGCAYC